jgi:hypothetical protein
MFRPCKRAIIRLFLEPLIGLYTGNMGGRELVLHHILWGYMIVNIYIDEWLSREKFFVFILNIPQSLHECVAMCCAMCVPRVCHVCAKARCRW